MLHTGTPHRRDDGELLGWIHPEGADWVAVDVLGRRVSGPGEWLDAEAALEEHGIAWLADPWMLEGVDDLPLRVRIVEVTPDEDGAPGRIVVKIDDFGDMTRPATASGPAAAAACRRPGSAHDLPVRPAAGRRRLAAWRTLSWNPCDRDANLRHATGVSPAARDAVRWRGAGG